MKTPLISNWKLWIAALITVGIVGILVLQRPQQTEQPIPAPKSTPVLHDVLFLAQTQISSFDPLDAFHEGHIQVVKQIYETLTDVDEHGNCVPLLASSWETTDNRVWRFHLKNNVLFTPAPFFASDAERHLETADVIYSFERLLAPESKSLGIAYFSDIAGFDAFHSGKDKKLRGVRAAANDVIEFELTKPDAGFYCRVSIPFASIVKQKAVTSLGADFKLHPVGTGPFTLASYKPDQQVILNRNPEFRKGTGEPPTPAVNEVQILLTRDENAAFAAFSSGTSDFLALDFAGLTRLRQEANSSAEITSQPTAKLQFYLFNLKTITKAEVRRAISASVNKQKLQELLGETATVAESIFPKAIFPYLAGEPSALSSAIPPKDSNSSPKKPSSELRLICFNDTLSRAVASRVADDLRANGYAVRIEAATFPVLVERLMRGEYDLVQIYWGPMFADPAHYLSPFLTSQFPPNGNNFNRYSNAAFDARIETAKATTDPVARQKLFLEAQDIMLRDMPLLPLYFENLVRASDKKFSLPTHPLLYRRYNLAQVK